MRLRAWLIGLVPLLVVVAVVGVVAVRHRSGVSADAPPGPVILVPGYGGGSDSLQRLAAALTTGGRRAVVMPPVGDNTGDLHAQAAALDATARTLQPDGAGSVDVVGFSAGGVVARVWAAGTGRGLVRRVVTLGSPHHGTDLAALAAAGTGPTCTLACRQLVPGSDLLDSLPEPPGGPRWTSIWTARDDVVVPPDSAVLRGALDIRLQDICPDDAVRHTGLPDDPLVVGLVRAALTGPGLNAAPAPSRCAALSSPLPTP